MLGGAKALFAIFGGFVGISGVSSLSFLELDPSNVWRVGANKKFYLSNCFNNPYDKNNKWTNSNLWIYLTVKGSNDGIQEGTQLELWAQGYGERINKGKITIPRWYKEISLQGAETTDFRSESSYTLNKETKVRLGEVGAGEDSQVFGDSIDCSNQIFDLTGTQLHGITSLGLNKVTFKLKRREQGKYKGREAYSIEITSNDGDKKLNWANNFKPIVIK